MLKDQVLIKKEIYHNENHQGKLLNHKCLQPKILYSAPKVTKKLKYKKKGNKK